ncbi:MAG: hypothetical protein NT076_03575 [Candidatus Pacearchaeota archaeon]|nr:hypothetical protein [Candidatus Pacearchaeota archaeon]
MEYQEKRSGTDWIPFFGWGAYILKNRGAVKIGGEVADSATKRATKLTLVNAAYVVGLILTAAGLEKLLNQ